MPSTLRRILCVDDDEDTCWMLTALLGQAHYESKTAGTVTEALRLAESEHFDLYILDGRFPDGRGLDLCRRLRELDPQARILFYSGDAYGEDREEGLAAGADAYLVKPEISALSTEVRRLLGEEELSLSGTIV